MAKVRFVSGPSDKVRGKKDQDYARKGEELDLTNAEREALEAQGFVFESAPTSAKADSTT